MRNDEYKPIGTFRPESRVRAALGAAWKPYTDDASSQWGPNGAFAQTGAGAQLGLDLPLHLEAPRDVRR